jgi:hypothetical protein
MVSYSNGDSIWSPFLAPAGLASCWGAHRPANLAWDTHRDRALRVYLLAYYLQGMPTCVYPGENTLLANEAFVQVILVVRKQHLIS